MLSSFATTVPQQVVSEDMIPDVIMSFLIGRHNENYDLDGTEFDKGFLSTYKRDFQRRLKLLMDANSVQSIENNARIWRARREQEGTHIKLMALYETA